MSRVAIIGAPRSGTVYCCEVLREFGLRIGHENTREDGGVGYNMIEKCGSKLNDYRCVFHVVRDPRYAIASAITNLPNFAHGGSFERYWFVMNEEAEHALKLAHAHGAQTGRFQIERAEYGLSKIASILRLPVDGVFDKVIRRNERRPYSPLTWSDLSQDVLIMAKRYGYDTRG